MLFLRHSFKPTKFHSGKLRQGLGSAAANKLQTAVWEAPLGSGCGQAAAEGRVITAITHESGDNAEEVCQNLEASVWAKSSPNPSSFDPHLAASFGALSGFIFRSRTAVISGSAKSEFDSFHFYLSLLFKSLSNRLDKQLLNWLALLYWRHFKSGETQDLKPSVSIWAKPVDGGSTWFVCFVLCKNKTLKARTKIPFHHFSLLSF